MTRKRGILQGGQGGPLTLKLFQIGIVLYCDIARFSFTHYAGSHRWKGRSARSGTSGKKQPQWSSVQKFLL